MNLLTKIKNVILDLGNVVLDISTNNTLNAFHQLGIKNPEAIYQLSKESKLFLNFELGKISVSDFLKQLKSYTPHKITNEQLISAWNAMLLPVPDERINLLRQLSKNFNLFLLSNTNNIHYQKFSTDYPFLKNNVHSEIFQRTFYSHHLGVRKPDEKIYLYLLEEAGLIAKETLFIDDLEENLKAANKMEINTMLATKQNGVVEIFKPYIQ